MAASQPVLKQIWDNLDDADYDRHDSDRTILGKDVRKLIGPTDETR